MTNKELGKEYLEKAEKIKAKLTFLENELLRKANLAGGCDRLDLNARIRILFEMYIDLKSTGEKLMGIKNENKHSKKE